ncbi:baseplate protein [Achromobacter phage Mano]|uniref:Baseplate protein n=1 Tax=Achromobacter phage Mano TaxID=2767570 RepID=A0A7L8G6B3_9CAUD|nr:tail protein [Achromobacter phage Mano]QOE32756.1 baseplate protein [Achromobacter phage Mano]
MIGLSLGAITMMTLGGFRFGINTAAYQTLKRKTEYRWAAQDRFGRREALQYTGPGTDSITLEGAIFPAYRGGTGQVSNLRALAATGRPHMLIDGLGNILGQWVIESVDEGQGTFAAFGIPRKQEFTVQIRKFDDGFGI